MMKNTNNSSKIASIVKELLEEKNWNYYFKEESGIFDFTLHVKGKIRKIKFRVVVMDDELLLYGICPVGADTNDEKMMAQMSEFFCRANFVLKNGCFGLDFQNGKIYYRTHIHCDGQFPSKEIIQKNLFLIAATIGYYEEGIFSIMMGDYSAKEAIERCERSMEKKLRTMFLEEANDAEEESE